MRCSRHGVALLHSDPRQDLWGGERESHLCGLADQCRAAAGGVPIVESRKGQLHCPRHTARRKRRPYREEDHRH